MHFKFQINPSTKFLSVTPLVRRELLEKTPLVNAFVMETKTHFLTSF